MAPIITLLTDFGLQDGYVASVKGVILTLCPQARLVDVSHLVPPQDIRSGAFVLASMAEDFPEGTIHLAVVDPGVGTERRGIVLRTRRYFFVGPDNGLFSWILKKEPGYEARSLENPQYWRPIISRTFHGRDIFAPVAAHLARGVPVDSFGPPCDPVVARWASAARTADGIHGEVVHIDRFGNVITNVPAKDLLDLAPQGQLIVQTGNHTLSMFVDAYGREAPGTVIVLIGSSETMEIAVNQGHASLLLGIRAGDPVTVFIKKQA